MGAVADGYATAPRGIAPVTSEDVCMEFLTAIWNHPLVAAAGAGLGALVVQIWRQYLQRMVTVRWSVTHETLAAGGDSPIWGRIDILHDGTPAGNLIQWCKVEIENESGSRDLSDVVVRLQYDPGTAFLSGGGALEGSNQALPLAPSFATEIDRFLAMPEADRKTMPTDFYCRREYLIPVLNRGAKANALFLVRPTVSNPTLRVYCDHLNVRLKHRPERPMIFGVVQAHARWTGLGVGSLVAVFLAMSLTNIWAAAFVALLVGWYGQLLGVAVIRAWRWLVRAIG